MQSDIRAGLTGGVAGALATIPMTAFMLAAQRTGFLGEAPPRLITDFALVSARLPVHDKDTETAVAGSVHFGFGAISGALFGALFHRVRPLFPRVVQGMLFGIAVWVVSYQGWVPALHIMPPPEDDRPGRPTVMILAHLIYGATLGWIVGRTEQNL